jgi:hypothetical protein
MVLQVHDCSRKKKGQAFLSRLLILLLLLLLLLLVPRLLLLGCFLGLLLMCFVFLYENSRVNPEKVLHTSQNVYELGGRFVFVRSTLPCLHRTISEASFERGIGGGRGGGARGDENHMTLLPSSRL